MAEFAAALHMYEQLKAEWSRPAADLERCRALLQKLKVAMIPLSFMPTPAAAGAGSGHGAVQELLLGRDVLELGVQWSARVGDVQSFERYMAQLKTYYFDLAAALPESAFMYQLLGLNLLRLLAQNRIADFHAEIERLDPACVWGT
jgi:26S proteasome regulatory subunit N12